MQVSIEEANGTKFLVIRTPIADPAPLSKSGKTFVVASSYGNKSFADVQVNGKPVTIGLNAYVKKD